MMTKMTIGAVLMMMGADVAGMDRNNGDNDHGGGGVMMMTMAFVY